jgi:pantoate--beta-alanine ligase
MQKNNMKTIFNISELKNEITVWEKKDLIIGLVPTMGALHTGHESLIKKAKESCDKVIVSIFVNPIQFGPKEDYSIYPRNLEKDQEICDKNGVDIIFHPDVSELYPDKNNITIVNPPECYKNKLCGKTRSGHFEGVATVVLKLFNITKPDKAFFGQKDAQQLIIIKKICKDLNVPVEIIGCPIIRDPDGLAISSRNQYLSTESREKALSLYQILKLINNQFTSKLINNDKIFIEALKLCPKSVNIEYLKVLDPDDFSETDTLVSGNIVAIAAKVDGVRLIDNIILK